MLLFLAAKGIVESVFQGWFSPQITAVVNGALDVAEFHYDATEANVSRNIRYLSEAVSELFPAVVDVTKKDLTIEEVKLLNNFLTIKRKEYGLFELAIVNELGESVVSSQSRAFERKIVDIPNPHLGAIKRSFQGIFVVRAEQSLSGEFMRGYAPIEFAPVATLSSIPNIGNEDKTELVARNYSIVATKWISPELSGLLASVVTAYDDYKELRTFRRPIVSSYNLTLVVVTLMILFAAIWVSFYLAKSWSVPIGLVAEGTQEVAHGNLDYRIPEVGDDELSTLVRSFNTMTGDLKQTTGELDERRRYMETVLANVGVGVISLNQNLQITTFNLAAARMLNVSNVAELQGRAIKEVLPKELTSHVEQYTVAATDSIREVFTDNISLDVRGESKHLQVTITQLVADSDVSLGVVVLLDDVTDLVSAQRMAAWREVARRIAHEIKNPLTPIQLCTQRIERRITSTGTGESVLSVKDKEAITESTEIVVKQVEMLRVLVNEFSQFAKMPKSNPRLAELNDLVEETVTIYKESHPSIFFELKLDEKIPTLELDPEQINRVLINLIDNALASISLVRANSKKQGGNPFAAAALTDEALVDNNESFGKITIETHYESELELVTLSLSDNGVGVAEEDKGKLFEPYFSKTKTGTGLGLAIVSTIITDHKGYIRVRDNRPRGATFVVELPVIKSLKKQLTKQLVV